MQHPAPDLNAPNALKPPALALLTLSSLLLTVPAQANTFADLSVEAGSEHNVSRGFKSGDIYDDEYLHLEGGLGKFLQIRPGHSVVLSISGAAQRYFELSGLDSDSIAAQAAYTHKFGLGAYAPALTLALGLSEERREGRARDRQLHDLTLGVSKRLSPAWSFYAAILHEWSEGTHDNAPASPIVYPWSARNISDDIYDFDQSGFFLSADYTFSNASMLTASYSFTDGYTVSSGLVPNARLANLSSAIAQDPAFGYVHGQYHAAYQLEADSHIYALDWSVVLGTDAALNFGYEYRDIHAVASTRYDGSKLGVTLSWAY
ncbi:MAG: hypothetical protein V4751_00705 [Pseudomonadota bacterium]